MPGPSAAKCHAMTDFYKKLYNEKTGHTPVYNRNTARWGFDGILRDYTEAQTKEMIEFFFTLSPAETRNFALDWFTYNYEKVWESLVQTKIDRGVKAMLLEESKRRTEEWLKREQSRTIGN